METTGQTTETLLAYDNKFGAFSVLITLLAWKLTGNSSQLKIVLSCSFLK